MYCPISCFSKCFNGRGSKDMPMRATENVIFLDSTQAGHEIVLLKNNLRACGSGAATTNFPLIQSKSYFEVKLQQSGHWSVGLCTLRTDLNKSRGGTDPYSWCLNAENLVLHDNQLIYDLNEMYSGETMGSNEDNELLLPQNDLSTAVLPSSQLKRSMLPQEGDIIGISYDHVELNFYLNGQNLNIPVLIKNVNHQPTDNPGIFPCLWVDDGAILDISVDNFKFPLSGYEKIMIEQSLL